MVKYLFKARVWKSKGSAGWYFATVPKYISKNIRSKHGLSEEGWGRLKTQAKIGNIEWKTSIWYDTKAGAYLLPLKAQVRKKESIFIDDRVAVILQLELEN